MFLDLNVPVENDPNFGSMGQTDLAMFLAKLGYDGLAYNVAVPAGRLGKEHACVLKMLPEEQIAANSSLNLRVPGRSSFQQYTRLTVTLEDVANMHNLNRSNPVVGSYDILAVNPTTEKAFRACCEKLEIDIISLDFSRRLPFYLKRPAVLQAIERDIFFEITYSGCLRDSGVRRSVISNALALHRAAKGRNIIVSSEAQRVMELRGPYDVMNLSTLFGFDQSTSKATLAKNCRAVLFHAETRRNTFRGISVAPRTELSATESGSKRKAQD